MNFVQNLEPHSGSVIFPEGYPSGHIRETVYMAGGPCPPSFPCMNIVIVEDIGCRMAAAGNAGGITAAAGYAPAFVFIPHIMSINAGGNFIGIRNRHPDSVFTDKLWYEFHLRQIRAEVSEKFIIFYFHQNFVIP